MYGRKLRKIRKFDLLLYNGVWDIGELGEVIEQAVTNPITTLNRKDIQSFEECTLLFR